MNKVKINFDDKLQLVTIIRGNEQSKNKFLAIITTSDNNKRKRTK